MHISPISTSTCEQWMEVWSIDELSSPTVFR
jgi:hypothetical protein